MLEYSRLLLIACGHTQTTVLRGLAHEKHKHAKANRIRLRCLLRKQVVARRVQRVNVANGGATERDASLLHLGDRRAGRA